MTDLAVREGLFNKELFVLTKGRTCPDVMVLSLDEAEQVIEELQDLVYAKAGEGV